MQPEKHRLTANCGLAASSVELELCVAPQAFDLVPLGDEKKREGAGECPAAEQNDRTPDGEHPNACRSEHPEYGEANAGPTERFMFTNPRPDRCRILKHRT